MSPTPSARSSTAVGRRRPRRPRDHVGRGTLRDYLPTTLRGYLALTSRRATELSPAAAVPRAQLMEQLEHLASAATEVLRRLATSDVDALMTQGNFLRTKFSRSDLDL